MPDAGVVVQHVGVSRPRLFARARKFLSSNWYAVDRGITRGSQVLPIDQDLLRRIGTPSPRRFEVQPKRWIVERTFGWLHRARRLSKSYERTLESDRAFLQNAMIHTMIKRLAP